ncbi:MAG: hypothetical protein JNJ46_06375 [Myxococcales bacterium]|nr:hypothetical protein [Myxococcales bacterium]
MMCTPALRSAFVVLGLLVSPGCAHQAATADAPASSSSGGEIATLERRIASAKANLSGGVSRGAASASAPAAAPSAAGAAPFTRCDGVCQAASEICTCHRRICTLADELKDGRSADSCRRSQRDCEDAGKSCAACGG